MAWTSVGAQGSFSDSALTGASRFTDDSTSDTTLRNASRFILAHPRDSSLASQGIDFVRALDIPQESKDLILGGNAARLFTQHHDALFRYLMRLTGDGDLAHDAIQETFTRLISSPPEGDNTGSVQLTLGNFDREAAGGLLRRVRALLQPGDRILLGLDLVKEPAVLEAAYNDAQGVTAAFNLNLWTHTLVELWAWQRSHDELCDRSDSPWDDPDRRPSHANRRKALRQHILRNELLSITNHWSLPRKIIQLAESLLALAA